MSFLYEYMNADELVVEKELARISHEAMEIEHACMLMESAHQLKINEIDTECLINEYTEDDLQSMYEAEQANVNEQKKSLWQRLKAFFKRIWNAIFNHNDEEKQAMEEAKKNNGEIEVPFDPNEVDSFVSKVSSQANKIINDKTGTEIKWDDVAKAIGIGVATTAAASTLGFMLKRTKTTFAKLTEFFISLGQKVKPIQDKVESAKEDDPNTSKVTVLTKLGNLLSSVIGKVKKAYDTALAKITGLFKKKDKKNSNEAKDTEKKEEGNTESEPEQKEENPNEEPAKEEPPKQEEKQEPEQKGEETPSNTEQKSGPKNYKRKKIREILSKSNLETDSDEMTSAIANLHMRMGKKSKNKDEVLKLIDRLSNDYPNLKNAYSDIRNELNTALESSDECIYDIDNYFVEMGLDNLDNIDDTGLTVDELLAESANPQENMDALTKLADLL